MTVQWGSLVLPFATCPTATAWPIATKDIAYPGVDGEERKDMGKRARQFVVEGFLSDITGTSGTSMQDILDIDTGAVDDLSDDTFTWSNVRPMSSPPPRVFDRKAATVDGVVKTTARYEIHFEQLQE